MREEAAAFDLLETLGIEYDRVSSDPADNDNSVSSVIFTENDRVYPYATISIVINAAASLVVSRVYSHGYTRSYLRSSAGNETSTVSANKRTSNSSFKNFSRTLFFKKGI